MKSHSKTHSYRVLNSVKQAIFDKSWSLQEEMMLLDGIEMYGLGNWRDISNFIGSKTESQCSKHYIAVYLESKTAPLPSGDPTTVATVTGSHNPFGQASVSSSSSSGATQTHVPKVEVAGYMPLRGDFDVEHDNDAEAIIADMEFAPDEHPSETALKLKILEIYNAKLDERERRKAFVIEMGLLDDKKTTQG
jgi:transcriptional adapter 2-alpha